MALIEVVPVRPQGASWENAGGAFTTALALCSSASGFRRRVRQDLEERGLRVIGFVDAPEPVDVVGKGHKIPRKTLALARKAQSGDYVYYQTFELYPEDERAGWRKRPGLPRRSGP